MQLPEIVLFSLTLLALAVVLGLLLSVRSRQRSAGDLERRLSDELRGSRDSFEQSLRSVSDSLGLKFDALQTRQAEAIAKGSTAQEERLDKVEAALRDFSEKQNRQVLEQAEKSSAAFTALQDRVTKSLAQFGEGQTDAQTLARRELTDALTALRKSGDESREAQTRLFEALRVDVRKSLDAIRTDNEQRLEKIRLTVDERLQATLEKRLGESFRQVSERLEQVHKGLGEMQNLAQGVGDLKRVLTNVRSRGTFGEVQLHALLEQVLVPSQYELNCATVPGSNDRVEFAIRLPGRDDDDTPLRLPIDAKFPQEDYIRLQQASEANDAVALDAARKALGNRMIEEAKRIRSKYVSPPHTTDFAILFVPTEGLFAEVLRMEGVAERMQTDWQIVLAGPTTLYAVLNSLQMGFRTLAIEKRSSEVWKILGAVKTEFGKFGAAIDAVGKKLQEAQNKLEDTSRRSRVMTRKLRDVEELPDQQTGGLLPELHDADADPDDE